MNEETTNPTPEPETEPETAEPETTPETSEPEPSEETETPEPETASAEPTTYGGVKPLDNVAEVLTFAEGSGKWNGTETAETLESDSATLSKTAVYVHRATDRLSNAYRVLATMLLAFRANVTVEREDGTLGPDWAGASDLSKRYTSLTISKPLAEAGADRARITSILNQISVYQGRKVPNQDYTLRDQFIRDWVRGQAADTGTEVQPSEVESRVDRESAAAGLKSARMATADRAANTAGPGQGSATNPLVALNTGVNMAVRPEAGNISEVNLIVEMHRIATKLALQNHAANGTWNDRPKVLEAFGPFLSLILGIEGSLDGKTRDWDDEIGSFLYGGQSVQDRAAAITADLAAAAAAETPDTVTETEPETATA